MEGSKDARMSVEPPWKDFFRELNMVDFFFEPSVVPFEETQVKLYFFNCRLMIRAGNNYQGPNKWLQYFERVYLQEVRESFTACLFLFGEHISERLTRHKESSLPDHRCQMPSFWELLMSWESWLHPYKLRHVWHFKDVIILGKMNWPDL